MGDWLRDIRFGVRILLKRPGTSALAVMALGLGIGLTTTMFSIVNAAFLRGLPFELPDRIVYVGRVDTDQATQRAHPTSQHDYVDWRAQQTAIEDLAAWNGASVDIAGDDVTPAHYGAARLTPNALRVLRVRPMQGRDFTDADAIDGAPPVALISQSVWMNQFGGDPHILGRAIRLNGEVTTIVGVMPATFGFPQSATVWCPLHITLAAKRGDGPWVDVFGRLKPGQSLAASQAEMARIGARLAQQYHENEKTSATTIPFVRRFLGGDVVTTLSTMLAAVFGVLLIACVNVTNLQLARAVERTKEVVLRLALGASRTRLIRQLVVEGLVLSAAGTLLGLGIAQLGVTLFRAAIAETNPPFWIIVRLDPTELAFATSLAVLAALASSLVPALQITRQDLNTVLKDEGRANTSLRVGRFSRMLVVVEVTLSFCLLVVSGLMIKSVITVNQIDFPFRTDVLHAHVDFVMRDYRDEAAVRAATERLQAILANAPELRQSALASSLPDRTGGTTFTFVGQPELAADAKRLQANRLIATPEFFSVMRIRLVKGRLFTERDRDRTDRVAIVTEDFVRRYIPRGDALGQQLRLGTPSSKSSSDPAWTIVGVVPPLVVSNRSSSAEGGEMIIVPLSQLPQRGLSVFVASAEGPTTATPALRRAVQAFDRDLPLSEIDTVKGRYDQQTWPLRVFGSLFMSFGLTSLLLAAAGLYGVMAFAVTRRTPEIGVRMALGADRRAILRMILRQGIVLVAIGITLGFGIAGWLGSQMKALLFRVDAWDPMVFGSTMTVLALAGLAACLVPALRAASVDPLVALRHD